MIPLPTQPSFFFGDDIAPGGAPHSLMCDLEIREGAVSLLLDDEERLVGIELLGASRLLPESVLAPAPRRDSG
jgi:hypothetical protein